MSEHKITTTNSPSSAFAKITTKRVINPRLKSSSPQTKTQHPLLKVLIPASHCLVPCLLFPMKKIIEDVRASIFNSHPKTNHAKSLPNPTIKQKPHHHHSLVTPRKTSLFCPKNHPHIFTTNQNRNTHIPDFK